MISYATVGCSDFAKSKQFYDAVLGAFGYRVVHDYSEGGWLGYCDPARAEDPTAQTLWLCKTPFNGAPASVGNGCMIGLGAKTRAQVDAAHAAALANGGTSEGDPGVREAYGPDFYVAYARDPMGNKMSFVCRG
jgi:catechol 2,3-dioxygenase-like lactoylglutathione lyase family enzyme